ncbi:MAG: hypothetical protein MUQ20_04805, partial [Deltaproteobacteria bacterium]|nr:hypothetical protein [Deltaproteobacteria bacterium]
DLSANIDLDIIGRFSEKYSVSLEVILRRHLDLGLVASDYYRDKRAEWNEEYIRMHGKSTGGDYYLTKLAYLGEGFTRLAFARFHQGQITRADLATHLNVKARNIDKLEGYLGW